MGQQQSTHNNDWHIGGKTNQKGGWGDPVAFIKGLECCTEGIVSERGDHNNNQGRLIDAGGENYHQNNTITVQSLTHETSKIFSQSKIDVKAVRYMIAQFEEVLDGPAQASLLQATALKCAAMEPRDRAEMFKLMTLSEREKVAQIMTECKAEVKAMRQKEFDQMAMRMGFDRHALDNVKYFLDDGKCIHTFVKHLEPKRFTGTGFGKPKPSIETQQWPPKGFHSSQQPSTSPMVSPTVTPMGGASPPSIGASPLSPKMSSTTPTGSQFKDMASSQRITQNKTLREAPAGSSGGAAAPPRSSKRLVSSSSFEQSTSKSDGFIRSSSAGSNSSSKPPFGRAPSFERSRSDGASSARSATSPKMSGVTSPKMLSADDFGRLSSTGSGGASRTASSGSKKSSKSKGTPPAAHGIHIGLLGGR